MQLDYVPFAFSSATWLGNNTASRDSGGLVEFNKKQIKQTERPNSDARYY